MASPEILDFERLLAPIPPAGGAAEEGQEGEGPEGGDAPARQTGIDLREEYPSDYHTIKDIRESARAAEKLYVADDEEPLSERPDWGPILSLGPKIIAEQSKDLDVAAWMIEALVRKHGYAGLRDGFRLARELVERYWDDLYPMPDDEDGVYNRVRMFAGLNGEGAVGVLISPINNVPFTVETSEPVMTINDYRQALDLARLEDPEKRERRIADGAATVHRVEKAVSETPNDFLVNVWEDLAHCVEEFQKLDALFDEKCGSDKAPPSSDVKNALIESQDLLKSLVGHLLETEESAEAEGGAVVPAGGGSDSAVAGRVATREDAFRALLKVAEFFKRTEPHSPISYALEQAVRWGKMPLPDLLSELVPDSSSREHLFKLVGIQPPEQEDH
ncbi:MAG: type VI secretion system protein TssA [Planctomycetota bacterium]|jgi:type VI secretion system protein ImpA